MQDGAAQGQAVAQTGLKQIDNITVRSAEHVGCSVGHNIAAEGQELIGIKGELIAKGPP